MEPFALLPFLQSLIRADFAQKQDGQTPNNTPTFTAEKETPIPTSSLQEEKNNACLQFFSSHDERVKRTKRP
jgi:hypothetical protein